MWSTAHIFFFGIFNFISFVYLYKEIFCNLVSLISSSTWQPKLRFYSLVLNLWRTHKSWDWAHSEVSWVSKQVVWQHLCSQMLSRWVSGRETVHSSSTCYEMWVHTFPSPLDHWLMCFCPNNNWQHGIPAVHLTTTLKQGFYSKTE
jgi:hypothetical protein